VASAPEGVELVATSRAELDLADSAACRRIVEEQRPDWVLNAGAYTAVDQAEQEPALAEAVNAQAPAAFAAALQQTGGRLLQLSTDFVFNGAQGHPYGPEQSRNPLGVYGASKARGEQAALLHPQARLLRTSWVYGPVGQNFLRTMLRLHAQRAASGDPLRVVADQVGCPTSTAGLARACWAVIAQRLSGVLHWSEAGVASWYDFAVAIGELAAAAGLLDQAALVEPITTADYPTPARRPAYSLLDCSTSRQRLGLWPQHWRAALQEVIADVGA